jgi:hypothetical protein
MSRKKKLKKIFFLIKSWVLQECPNCRDSPDLQEGILICPTCNESWDDEDFLCEIERVFR